MTAGRCLLFRGEQCRTHKSRYQVPIAELAQRWTELPQVSDESRSFFRVHTGYFSNIPKCIKAEFIASWACSQSSVVSSSQRLGSNPREGMDVCKWIVTSRQEGTLNNRRSTSRQLCGDQQSNDGLIAFLDVFRHIFSSNEAQFESRHIAVNNFSPVH
ncbi:hypothetical protein TNCV_3877711 [Trichonephila clavipes]|uniref:Uncharacterized protein n=1 Tax=Trichonephila clavipes TaxID=2585209 RepID=A0A8X6T5I0_TRICX|nr:hypothetical protein TNCV_3877711 [Trichonephila clavipes]